MRGSRKKRGIVLYSVIDIGSNTVRLAIYRLDPGSGLTSILNNKYTVGLAAYVDKSGAMAPEGTDRLVEVMGRFRAALDLLPGCECFPFATASLRNITNREEVLESVRERAGFDIRVLSGYEEAMLDYRGAVRSMPGEEGLLVDVGGGSTELVFFKAGRAAAARSVPLGSLSLFNKCVAGIIPTASELAALKAEARRALLSALPDSQGCPAQPMCGVGGTARGVLALYRGMAGEPPKEGYGTQFFLKLLRQAQDSPKKLTRRILKIAPERVHTMLPGVALLSAAAEIYGSRTVVTSPYGVREGYLLSILEGRGVRI